MLETVQLKSMNMEKIVCCGGGTIGAGFAYCFARAGFNVYILEINPAAAEKALVRVSEICASMQALGVKTDAEDILSHITAGTDPEQAYTDASLVQESGPESLDIKRALLATAEKYIPRSCAYASSTSSLSISEIAENAVYPERCFGAHPFNPVHLIPLVELTKTAAGSDEVLSQAMELYRRSGREPVVVNKERPGFIANRIQHAVLREVIAMVTEGVCSLDDADRALVYGPGLRWGAIGQGLIGELASPEGAKAFNISFKSASERIFRDLSCMTQIPESWPELCGEGVEREKAQNPDFIGHTPEEIAAFRDRVLIELLKLHGKL